MRLPSMGLGRKKNGPLAAGEAAPAGGGAGGTGGDA
jgi:hypothetical protein